MKDSARYVKIVEWARNLTGRASESASICRSMFSMFPMLT